jgi:hypothetical protein
MTPIYGEDVLRSSMGDGDRKAEAAPTVQEIAGTLPRGYARASRS